MPNPNLDIALQTFWITTALVAVACAGYAVKNTALYLLELAQLQRQEQYLRLRLQNKQASGKEQDNEASTAVPFFRRPIGGSEAKGFCQAICSGSKLGQHLLKLLNQAGLEGYREATLQWWLVVLGLVVLFGLVLGSVLLAVTFCMLAFASSFAYLQFLADKRCQALRAAIPDVLDELAQSLRAGRSFPQALRFVLDGQSTDGPAIDLLRRLDADASLGRSCSKSLREMAVTTELRELKSIAAVVDITAQVGGSAPALYEQAATSLRQDLMLNKKLKVQTAQGRSSVRLVGTVPFALIGLLSLVMPGYLGLWLSTSGGQTLFALAVGLVAVGFFWVRSVVNICV